MDVVNFDFDCNTCTCVELSYSLFGFMRFQLDTNKTLTPRADLAYSIAVPSGANDKIICFNTSIYRATTYFGVISRSRRKGPTMFGECLQF